jgi:uncharacterized protein (DUF58 family)
VILAALALLVPVAAWIAPILAAAFLILVAAAIIEAALLRRIVITIDRMPRLALPLDEPDTATIGITTNATRPLRIVVRQRWPELVAPHSQTVYAISRPREMLNLDFALRGIVRGAKQVDPVSMAMTMFGLAERIVAAGDETTVHVLPNLRAVKRLHKRLNDYALRSLGARAAPRIGKGRDFDRLRDYVVDDDFRDVAWHASARHGRLIVREFRLDRSQEILLCVDRGHRMAARVEQITRLDHAVNAAVLISYVCNRMEDKFAVMSFSAATQNGVGFGRGASQLRAVTAYTSSVDAAYQHTDYLALAAALRKRLRHRTLILMLTVLPEREDRYDLLRAVGMLAPQHLPLIVTLTDRNLRAAAQLLPSNRAELSRTLVARDLWLGRLELIRELRSRGALVVEATPEDAGVESINAYIDVKRRQLL